MANPATKTQESAPTFGMTRRHYVEAIETLNRIDAALARGDVEGARAAAEGLKGWLSAQAKETVGKNKRFASMLSAIAYNLEILVPGTEANKKQIKLFSEQRSSDDVIVRYDRIVPQDEALIIGSTHDGIDYARANLLQAGTLACLSEAASMNDSRQVGRIMDGIASVKDQTDLFNLLSGVPAKKDKQGFYVSYSDVELSGKAAGQQGKKNTAQIGPRFVEGSALADIDAMASANNLAGVSEAARQLYAQLCRMPEIEKREPIEARQLDVSSYQQAGLLETTLKGGEFIVPLVGAEESGRRAYKDFKESKFVLGIINTVSAMIQLAFDVALFLSWGRAKEGIVKGRLALRTLQEFSEKKLSEMVESNARRALGKELENGIAKATLEKLENSELNRMYQAVLEGTMNQAKGKGLGSLTRKDLGKIAAENARKVVEHTRISEKNVADLRGEMLRAGGLKGKAMRAMGTGESGPTRVKNWLKDQGKKFKRENMASSAKNMREKANALREDAKQMKKDQYTLPYLAVGRYGYQKFFMTPAATANRLSANFLKARAWSLEKVVQTSGWASNRIGLMKDAVRPKFRNTPVSDVWESKAYRWGRITSMVGMGTTEYLKDKKFVRTIDQSIGKGLFGKSQQQGGTATYTHKITPTTSSTGKPAIKVEIFGKSGAAYEGTVNAFENGERFASNKAIGKGFEFLIVSPIKGATYRITDIQGREIVSFKY